MILTDNYYDVLEVPESASENEIKKAYLPAKFVCIRMKLIRKNLKF